MQLPDYRTVLDMQTIIKIGSTYVHVVEALENVCKSAVVGDVLVHLDFALEIIYARGPLVSW